MILEVADSEHSRADATPEWHGIVQLGTCLLLSNLEHHKEFGQKVDRQIFLMIVLGFTMGLQTRLRDRVIPRTWFDSRNEPDASVRPV